MIVRNLTSVTADTVPYWSKGRNAVNQLLHSHKTCETKEMELRATRLFLLLQIWFSTEVIVIIILIIETLCPNYIGLAKEINICNGRHCAISVKDEMAINQLLCSHKNCDYFFSYRSYFLLKRREKRKRFYDLMKNNICI